MRKYLKSKINEFQTNSENKNSNKFIWRQMWLSTAKSHRPVFLADIKWLLSAKYVPACTVTFSLVKGSKNNT